LIIMRHTRHLTASLIFALTACPEDDDNDDTGADTGSESSPSTDPTTESSADTSASAADTSTGEDPFADCDRGTLEADISGADMMGNPIPLVWMGPGVDPETGMLVDDGSTYVVSSTYLAMKPDPAAQQAFGEVTPPLVPELFGNPGVVAFQLGTSNACASARTLTVWRDEAAMMTFVAGDAHMAAIGRVAEISRGTSVVAHWSGASVADITWENALTQVLADEGPFY
jgi:quinol monooxygenase YgiN